MRLVHAAALAAGALLLASAVGAQGIGDAAAKEREKRKTGATKPVKVFNDSNLGNSSAAAEPAPADASGATPAGDATKGDAKAKPKTEAELEADAEKEHQKVVDAWKAKLEDARKEEQQYKEQIDRLQLDLNDSSGMYTYGRARKLTALDEAKQKLADAQARIASLEDEGRRSGYR